MPPHPIEIYHSKYIVKNVKLCILAVDLALKMPDQVPR